MSRREQRALKHYKRMQSVAVLTMIVIVSAMSIIALGGMF